VFQLGDVVAEVPVQEELFGEEDLQVGFGWE
jgi:hypothetical protein